MFKLPNHIRILPIVIFLSVLALSIRISSIVESMHTRTIPHLRFNETYAAESSTPEAEALTSTLKASDYKDASSSTQKTEDDDDHNNAFTQSELQLLQELAERREALDLRSKEIDKKALQLKVSEQEIDKRLKQMQEYEQKLKLLIQEYNEKEKEKIASLVKLYATMKPKDAARIFQSLDLDVTVVLLKEMKPSVASAILAQIPAAKAKAITDKIIGNAF